MQFGIGQPVTRKEDPRFLTGRGQYVADIDLAHQTHAVFIYSPHAHATIKSIDTKAAAGGAGRGRGSHRQGLCRRRARHHRSRGHARGHGRPQGLPHPPHAARGRARALCRRARRRRHRRERGAGRATRPSWSRSTTRFCPRWCAPCDAVKPGAPLVYDGAPNNISLHPAHGQRRRGRSGLRQGGACHQDRALQQPPQRLHHGAARLHRRI